MVCAFVGIIVFSWLILICWLIATIDTGLNGFFTQIRIGQDGKHFKIIKIRSMRNLPGVNTTVTTDKDPRISSFGRFLRKTKIDELPQLWNVLIGKMSFVGPRPDVSGYADQLLGDDRIVLKLKPGITGPASLFFKNEEHLLALQENPKKFNDEVIWQKKVSINREYYMNYSFWKDFFYIVVTVFNIDIYKDSREEKFKIR